MKKTEPSGLLVSVRSASEAQAALEGGAALIDVKEPSLGSLGRAENHVISEVLAQVAGRLPVSAALGELTDPRQPLPGPGLAYIKWGLAGCQRWPGWREELARLTENPEPPQVVLTAYADWECAQAPHPDEVFALASTRPGSVILLDTCCKDARPGGRKPTLLDWLPHAWIDEWCRRCRKAKIRVALAGSLGIEEIEELRATSPDWFAVRGAVCADGERSASIDASRVRKLVDRLTRTIL